MPEKWNALIWICFFVCAFGSFCFVRYIDIPDSGDNIVMMKDCTVAEDQLHKWSYDNSVYSPPVGCSSDSVAVHRQCYLCGKHEMTVSKNWRDPYGGYDLPDLRGE